MALLVIGVLAIALLVSHLKHRDNSSVSSVQQMPIASVVSTTQAAVIARPESTSEILAGCHPQLSANSGFVPNFTIGANFNPAGVRLKVRFFVSGDGFVQQLYVTGSTVVDMADQQAALDYVRHLTFLVPNTENCNSKMLEMNGNFIESMDSSGQWVTAFEIYPRYSFDDNGRVIQLR